MKARQDNDMIDRIGAIYTEKETKLLWSIGSSAVCDEYLIGQQHDQTYGFGLRQKLY